MTMKGLVWCVALLAGLFSQALGQDFPREFVFTNHILDPSLRTVQLYRGEAENSFPYRKLHSDPVQLTLEFDEITTQPSEFQVNYVHCNADWRASDLMGIEYLEGLQTDYIRDFQLSQATQVRYVHYTYKLPSDDIRFKVSGNYVLWLSRRSDPNTPVLFRRFVVVEDAVNLMPAPGLVQGGAVRQRLQQVNFSLVPGPVQVVNPSTDFTIAVLQNFNWTTASTIAQPSAVFPDRIEFAFSATNDFSGGNEFRLIDLRSTRGRVSPRVTQVSFEPNSTRAVLMPDRPRTAAYFSEPDFNGGFYIRNRDALSGREALTADYLTVNFRLLSPPRSSSERVYVWGALSDWQLDPRFELRYNDATGMYESEVPLKQGVYDYKYVVVGRDGKRNEAAIEGSYFETENYYTLIAYYRGFTGRFDRVVGLRHVNFYDR